MKAAEEGGSPVYDKSVEILQLQRIIRDCGERKRKTSVAVVAKASGAERKPTARPNMPTFQN